MENITNIQSHPDYEWHGETEEETPEEFKFYYEEDIPF
mgnify:CR=1 FL=1